MKARYGCRKGYIFDHILVEDVLNNSAIYINKEVMEIHDYYKQWWGLRVFQGSGWNCRITREGSARSLFTCPGIGKDQLRL